MPEQKSIPVDELHVDPANVRPVDRETGGESDETILDLDSGHGLYPDVKDEGVLQPLVVRPHDGEYGVVIGTRRLAAARAAGLDEVPCVIREDLKGDDEKAQLESMKENLHRTDIPDWKKRELIQEMYSKTDGRKSKYKRANKVADKLNVSRETVYTYVDFEKLDPTLNIRQKEPSERTDEEIGLLESSLPKNALTATDETEDLDEDEYRREKAKGFPALGKIPTRIGKRLHRFDFFLELQEEDLAKAHELATEAVDVGRKQAPKVINEWRKEMEAPESEDEKAETGGWEDWGAETVTLEIEVRQALAEALDEMVEDTAYQDRSGAAATAIENYLADEGYIQL